jgi:hypothetical protein
MRAFYFSFQRSAISFSVDRERLARKAGQS